jgi:hypothetical protein
MSTTGVAMPFMRAPGYEPSKLGDRDADARAKDAQKYLQVLAEERLPYEPMIDNLIMYCSHGRRSIQGKDLWPGQPTGLEVFADTAMISANMLVNGMVGYLCSRNQPWFAFELPGKLNFPRTSNMRSWSGKRMDSYPEVQKWLQDSADVSYSAFNRSNFYDVSTEFMRDGITTGTAHLLVEDDVAQARTVCTVPHFRECYIAENDFGQVDTNYRVYKMTLRQMVQKFSLETMERADNNFKKDYESNMHAEREVLHAVYPRKDYQPGRIDAKGKKWASDWVYRKGGRILGKAEVRDDQVTMLSEGGYDSMPSMSWRWRKNSDELYGRGPAHDAWVSIALDNQMGRTNLITGQKAAEPPLVAYSDQRGQIQRGPNGITFLEANRGDIRARAPMPLNGTGVQQLPFNLEFQDRVAQTVKDHFHTDVFMLLSQIGQQKGMGRPVTEQIFEMQNEKAAILGTIIGNLQSEGFNPLISRFFDIEARAGRIPEAPQILLDSEHGPVEIQYLGMLAQAQTRLTKVRAIQSGVGLVQQITAFDPLAMHAIDTDQMVREAWDAVGAPISCLRDPKAIAQIRQMAQQQQEKQQQIENAPKIAKAAALAGKGAEQDSPLKALMSGGQAQ